MSYRYMVMSYLYEIMSTPYMVISYHYTTGFSIVVIFINTVMNWSPATKGIHFTQPPENHENHYIRLKHVQSAYLHS